MVITNMNTPVDIDLNPLVSDVDGDALSFGIAGGGSLSPVLAGVWQYTPASGFYGLDFVSWSVNDGVASKIVSL
jgi:hypothetical protein